jgi:hypothetical protein
VKEYHKLSILEYKYTSELNNGNTVWKMAEAAGISTFAPQTNL